jgi:hypothetical protein
MPSMRSTIAGHEPMPYNDVMLGREKKEGKEGTSSQKLHVQQHDRMMPSFLIFNYKYIIIIFISFTFLYALIQLYIDMTLLHC